MTIPRIPSLLIMLVLGQDALALQMGQITGASVRGQPLLARVSLYGMAAHEAGDTVVELLPAFGDGAETLSQYGLQARLSHDEPDGQAIIVTSTQPIEAATLTLRVRLREGSHALVRHYELTIPAAAGARLNARADAADATTVRPQAERTRRRPLSIRPRAATMVRCAPVNRCGAFFKRPVLPAATARHSCGKSSPPTPPPSSVAMRGACAWV